MTHFTSIKSNKLNKKFEVLTTLNLVITCPGMWHAWCQFVQHSIRLYQTKRCHNPNDCNRNVKSESLLFWSWSLITWAGTRGLLVVPSAKRRYISTRLQGVTSKQTIISLDAAARTAKFTRREERYEIGRISHSTKLFCSYCLLKWVFRVFHFTHICNLPQFWRFRQLFYFKALSCVSLRNMCEHVHFIVYKIKTNCINLVSLRRYFLI